MLSVGGDALKTVGSKSYLVIQRISSTCPAVVRCNVSEHWSYLSPGCMLRLSPSFGWQRAGDIITATATESSATLWPCRIDTLHAPCSTNKNCTTQFSKAHTATRSVCVSQKVRTIRFVIKFNDPPLKLELHKSVHVKGSLCRFLQHFEFNIIFSARINVEYGSSMTLVSWQLRSAVLACEIQVSHRISTAGVTYWPKASCTLGACSSEESTATQGWMTDQSAARTLVVSTVAATRQCRSQRV